MARLGPTEKVCLDKELKPHFPVTCWRNAAGRHRTSTKALRGECAWKILGQARSVRPELKEQGREKRERQKGKEGQIS